MPLVMNRPEDFVTVVEVQESKKLKVGDDFVTVVAVGDQNQSKNSSTDCQEEVIVEDVCIYRLPGEKLGMALKFEGGISATQPIDRVFVQNVNDGGPASKARGSRLGLLKEADEIIHIQGNPVSGMTRINCVNCLREAPVCITMTVKRHPSSHQLSNGNNNGYSTESNGIHGSDLTGSLKAVKKGPPPPVPPRLSTTTLSSAINTQSTPNNKLPPVMPSKGSSSPQQGKNNSSTGRPKRSPPPLPPRRPNVPPPSAPKPTTKSQSNGSQSLVSPASSSNHANQTSFSQEKQGIISDNNYKSSDTKVTLPSSSLPQDVSNNETPIKPSSSSSSSPSQGVTPNNSLNNNSHNLHLQQHHPHQSPVTPTTTLDQHLNIDLFASPDFGIYVESESDDTGSSVSTVIERFNGSSRATLPGSLNPTSDGKNNRGSRTPTIDIEDVLGPFEQLERELDHKEALQRFMEDTAAAMNAEAKMNGSSSENNIPEQPVEHNSVNLDDYDDIQSVSMTYAINEPTCKDLPAKQPQPTSQNSNSKSPNSAPLVLSATAKSNCTTKQVTNNNHATTKKSGRKDVINATAASTQRVSRNATKANNNSVDSHGESCNQTTIDNKRKIKPAIKSGSNNNHARPTHASETSSSSQSFINGNSATTKAVTETLPRKSLKTGNQSKYNSVDNLSNKSLSSSSTPTNSSTPRIRPGILKKTSGMNGSLNQQSLVNNSKNNNNNILTMKSGQKDSKNRSSPSHSNGQVLLNNNSLIPKLDFAKTSSSPFLPTLPSRKYHSTGNLAFGMESEKPSLIPRPVSTKVVTFAPNLVQTVHHPKDDSGEDDVDDNEVALTDQNIYLDDPFASSDEILDNEVEVMDIDKEMPLLSKDEESKNEAVSRSDNDDHDDHKDDEIEGVDGRRDEQLIEGESFINGSQATLQQECPDNKLTEESIESAIKSSEPIQSSISSSTPVKYQDTFNDYNDRVQESSSRHDDTEEQDQQLEKNAATLTPSVIDSDINQSHDTLVQLTPHAKLQSANQEEAENQQDIIELKPDIVKKSDCQTTLCVHAVKIDRSFSQDSGITVSPEAVIHATSSPPSLTEKLVNTSVNINPSSTSHRQTNNRHLLNDSGVFLNESSVSNISTLSSNTNSVPASPASSFKQEEVKHSREEIPIKEVVTKVVTPEVLPDSKEGSVTDTELSSLSSSIPSSLEDNVIINKSQEVTTTESESRMESPGVEYDFPLTSVRERIALFQKHFSEQNIPKSLKVVRGPSANLTSRSNAMTENKWMSRSIDSKLFSQTESLEPLTPVLQPSSWSTSTHHLRSSPPLAKEAYSSGEVFPLSKMSEKTVSSSSLSFPQSSLPNKPYVASVLTPSYKRFTSYDPLIRTTSNGCLPRLTTPSPTNTSPSHSEVLANLLQSRRQNTTKLKGLVIPDQPSSLTPLQETTKVLPTIMSSEMVLNKSEDLLLSNQSVIQQHHQQPSSSNARPFTSVSSSLFQSFDVLKNTIPKYSPAFKRRALEVSRPNAMLSPAGHLNSSDSMSRINSLPLGSRNFSLKFAEDNEQQEPSQVMASNACRDNNSSTNCLHIETKFSPPSSCSSSVDLLHSTSSNSSNHSDDSGLADASSHSSSSSSILVGKNNSSTNKPPEVAPSACSWSTSNHQENSSSPPASFSSHLTVVRNFNSFNPTDSEKVSTVIDNNTSVDDGLSQHFRSLSLKWKQRVMQEQQQSQQAIIGKLPAPTPRKRSPPSQETDQDPALPLLNSLQDTIKKNNEQISSMFDHASLLGNASDISNKAKNGMQSLERKSHYRVSSVDSTSSDSGTSTLSPSTNEPPVPPVVTSSRTNSVTNLGDSQYGSVTSLASSTSLISPQDLQQLIDEANQSLDSESPSYNHNPQVIVLSRDINGTGSTGIILAGGADHETKEISIHKIISGSLADRDGRLRRGDRVISINGKIIKGFTRQSALDILRSPRPQVVIVISRPTDEQLQLSKFTGYSFGSRSDLSTNKQLASESSLVSDSSSLNVDNTPKTYKTLSVILNKDGAGLGFILEGGKDYPLCPGGKALSIKKIFRGGLAEKEGTLMAGDEILFVNEESVANMTRTEAWNFLKKLPDVPVTLTVRRVDYGY